MEGCAKGSQNEGFFSRLKDSYKSHLAWDGPRSECAAQPKLSAAPKFPMSNPPWPYSTWNIGGSQAIGVENMYYSALMDALYIERTPDEVQLDHIAAPKLRPIRA